MGKKITTTDELVEKLIPIKENKKSNKSRWHKTLGLKLVGIVKAIADWIWNAPVPYLVFGGLIGISFWQIFTWLQEFAKGNDSMKYLVGGIMLVVISLSINRISVLFRKK